MLPEEPKDFAEWRKFAAKHIVDSSALVVPEEARPSYIRVQIEAALGRAYAHGRNALTESDPPFCPTDEEVEAAGRVLHAIGLHHHWWGPYRKSYDEAAMDAIGNEEFDAVVEKMLMAAAAARR